MNIDDRTIKLLINFEGLNDVSLRVVIQTFDTSDSGGGANWIAKAKPQPRELPEVKNF